MVKKLFFLILFLFLCGSAEASILTSGGITFPGALTLNYAGTVALNGAWINTGLVTFSAATNLNYNASSAETLTCNGGITMSSVTGTTPTATIIWAGGTFTNTTSSRYIYNNFTINPTIGNITVASGSFLSLASGSNTLTYIHSGTNTVTTTSSTLFLYGSVTLTTDDGAAHITWNDIKIGNSNITVTLGSNLYCTGILYVYQSGTTWAGVYNISCGTLSCYYYGTATTITHSFVAGRTLTITAAMNITGDCSQTEVLTIQSTTSASTYFNYTGTLTNQKVAGMNFTYISTAGANWVTSHAYIVGDLVNTGGSKYLCAIAHTSGTFATDLGNGDWTFQNTKWIYNYCGGTLSNTSGITNINANNTGGFYIE